MTNKSLSLSLSLIGYWVCMFIVFREMCFWVYYLPPNFYFILFLFCWENAFCSTFFDFLVKIFVFVFVFVFFVFFFKLITVGLLIFIN